MTNLRHVVNVMRPPPPGGESTVNAKPSELRHEVPCSIEPLRGGEAQRLQQMFATATHKVGMYGNPNKKIQRTDFCIDQTGARLNVMDVIDKSRSQIGFIELVCGEEPK